jgi:hypothetical protein
MQRNFLIVLFLFNFSLLSAQEDEGSGVSDTIVYIQDTDTIREIIIEEVSIRFDRSKFKVKLIKQVKENKGLVDIADAKILISGVAQKVEDSAWRDG